MWPKCLWLLIEPCQRKGLQRSQAPMEAFCKLCGWEGWILPPGLDPQPWLGLLWHFASPRGRWSLPSGALPLGTAVPGPHRMPQSEPSCLQVHLGLRFIRSFSFQHPFMSLWSLLGKRATCFLSGLNGFDQKCGLFFFFFSFSASFPCTTHGSDQHLPA